MAVFTKRDIGGGVDLWPRDSVNITAQSPDNPLYHIGGWGKDGGGGNQVYELEQISRF